ncbi:ATPase domain of HSP90 chaperone/DNA topoisomerase II/histidine kinase protein [Dioscorea alata]|uniref:ATPase domain of HSP90 chaperone/DNA topoisomerase II/histidine kinase protein n=1 Tax=Dioscorea alata TaxID=55571 RepID=A0ACB7WGB3_DIOAL|nr:ATPase domain of HSP90 chaperone/DNA topoisomerase II/histidine kinase protein [Dioscorea alata]
MSHRHFEQIGREAAARRNSMGQQAQEELRRQRRPVLECRSFWKAGSFDVNTAASSSTLGGDLDSSDFERARVHPKFLHTNATSHKWAFGAVAELLDNAVDEICNGATFVIVDKVNNPRDDSPMLVIQDDGGGMDPEGIRRCMSLGFSSKGSKKTIGQYGNGFKTSTMRLGADAIVFTRANRGSSATQSIGLLSYTYLRRTMKDDIIVPTVHFEILDGQAIPLPFGSQENWDGNLKTILDWSPFSSREELMLQFENVGSHGTQVLIYNLWMDDDDLLELDFDDDDEDIVLRDHVNYSGLPKSHKEVVRSHISYTFRCSLRAYISILYLRKFPKFQIILRGKPVEQLNIADELKFRKVLTYKPQVITGSENASVKITMGFAKEAPILGIFGFNVYHKNRLIMPFWKVLQEGSSRGRSVLGVLEANFIEPAHDKQDFERTPLFLRLETKLRQIVLDYWKENCYLIGYQSRNPEIRNKQKQSGKFPHEPAANVAKELPHSESILGLSANAQREFQAAELASLQPMDLHGATADRVAELAAVSGSSPIPSGKARAPLITYHSEVPADVLDSSLIEKISEENLELFVRRGELQSNYEKLKKTIEELEQELALWKRKLSRLTVEVENQRKQQSILKQ